MTQLEPLSPQIHYHNKPVCLQKDKLNLGSQKTNFLIFNNLVLMMVFLTHFLILYQSE